jgi:peptidoglycan/LPS O-acetylase OafA/YrhL
MTDQEDEGGIDMNNNVATTSGEAPRDVGERSVACQPTGPALRIHYFDWLRAIAVLGVVVYHSVLPFARPWVIRNAETSDLLHAVVVLFETFGLAVLFLIAGAGVRWALQRRSTRAFLAERAKRLLVPFAVGAIVLVPPIYYIIGLHLGTLSISYPVFLVAYPSILWTYNISKLGLSPEVLSWIGMHLWFLAWLFICSALALPFFAFLSSSVGRSCLDVLARVARWRGATLLWAVPVTLPRLGLAALSSAEYSWSLEAFAWYAALFVVGYLLYSDDRFVAAIRRDVGMALIVAVLGSPVLLAAGYGEWVMVPKTFGTTYFFMMGLAGITGWAWTITVLGWGMRAGFMQRPLPAGAAEASLPVYVLHYTIMAGITALVVQWPLGLAAKILVNVVLVAGASLLVTAAVLRIPALRPLLGLRPVQSGTRPATGGHFTPLPLAG